MLASRMLIDYNSQLEETQMIEKRKWLLGEDSNFQHFG
jgi:hypothetical protein